VTARRLGWLIALTVLLAMLAGSLYWVSRPPRVASLLLDRIGSALGLQITASGVAEYRLRGTPMLLLHNVVAREPGAAQPLLRANRIYLSLPWSTIRARGDDLTVTRVELDRPQLDLPALQHWLTTRPPSVETRIPTLTDGLRITGGSVVGEPGGWRIEGIEAQAPSLHPDRPFQAHLRGRYMDLPLAVPFDVAVRLGSPGVLAGGGITALAVEGALTIQRDAWRLPARLALSGPLRWRLGTLAITPVHFGMSARYEAGTTRLPFALGLHGPLRYRAAAWALAPTGLALRGSGASGSNAGGSDDNGSDPVPRLDAYGALGLGRQLSLQLDGAIADWPAAWPPLPAPIGQSSAPMPFALRYRGKPDLSDTASLQLRRDATRFDGRFRLPQMLEWSKAAATASPLPPIDGTLTTPTLQISGATLQGVEIEFDAGDDEPGTPSP